MESIQGRALVASPYLTDPNFLRSVVYILRHDEEGAVGLILNRPMRASVGDLLEQLCEVSLDNSQPVYCGGPVDGPLMMLQACQAMADEEGSLSQVVCVSSDPSKILEVCTQAADASQPRCRLFDGYAGWGAAQLERELKEGGWLLWDIQPEQIFCDSDELWHTAVQEIGRDILTGGMDPSKIPVDPAFN